MSLTDESPRLYILLVMSSLNWWYAGNIGICVSTFVFLHIDLKSKCAADILRVSIFAISPDTVSSNFVSYHGKNFQIFNPVCKFI